MLPTEIADAIVQLDLASAAWPEADRVAWRLTRGYLRRQHRTSSTAMPAVSLAAQEMVQARDHAHRAIDAMSGVFGHENEKETDDER